MFVMWNKKLYWNKSKHSAHNDHDCVLKSCKRWNYNAIIVNVIQRNHLLLSFNTNLQLFENHTSKEVTNSQLSENHTSKEVTNSRTR